MKDGFYYNCATHTADNILNEISSTYQIDLLNIRWKHFVNLLKEKYSVSIEPHVFNDPNLNARLAGVAMLGNYPLIQFNNSIMQSEERKHFTIVHEGVHFFRHKDDPNAEGEAFTDIIENSAYSPEEQAEELITNQTASIIMLNNSALLACMQNRWSYGKITGFYGMSGSALFERLVNYLHFNLKIKSESARYLVGRFRYGDTVEACGFLPILITNFDKFVDWFDDFPLTGNMLDELYLNLGLGFETPASHWYQLNHIFSKTNLNASIAANMQK